MAINYANVEVSTDTFESWVIKTNQLVTALRDVTLTANATSVNAGQTTGNAELIGVFAANSVMVSGNATSGGLRGGNTSTGSNTLYVVSNTVFTPNGVANSSVLSILANSSASNVNLVAGKVRITGNTSILGNSSITALNITGNSTVTDVAINASSTAINSNVTLSGDTHAIAGNSNFDSGTLFVDSVNNRIGVNNTTPDASLSVTGTANVSGNVTLGGTSHLISGNSNFDSGVLFVDSVNNRVGINNTTPDAALSVTGSANISGAVAIAGQLTTANISGASINATSINVGANVSVSTSRINVGNSTVNTAITSTGIDTDGILAVLGATTLSNTVSAAGLASLNAGMNTTTANATAVNVGANINLSTTQINIGNSTVNTVLTSTSITTGAITANGLANLTGGVNTATANATSINVGANVNLSTSQINVGNSTVNTVVSATGIDTDGTLAVLGVTTLSSNVNVDSGTLFVDSVNNRVGINNTTPDASLTITGTANISGLATLNGGVAVNGVAGLGNTTITGFANVSTTLQVTGAATLSNTLSVTGLATIATANVTGATNFRSTLTANGATTVSNTLNVTGLTTLATANATGAVALRSTLTVNGAVTVANTLAVTSDLSVGGITTFETDYVIDVVSNTGIGSGNVVVYSFPKATYSSGKFTIQAKNTGNTQIMETILAHDNTTAVCTTYGTVRSPAGSGFIDVQAAINNANVELTIVQIGVSNSAIKIAAHLIK